jgi:hypothetical protein
MASENRTYRVLPSPRCPDGGRVDRAVPTAGEWTGRRIRTVCLPKWALSMRFVLRRAELLCIRRPSMIDLSFVAQHPSWHSKSLLALIVGGGVFSC